MTALAIFVKTPGLSPVKTRLAAGIGQEAAGRFYEMSLRAVADIAGAALGITPYWAVAEPHATSHALWASFPTLWQGEGGLGDRLDHVYATLRERHGQVLLVGADSPQITVDLLHQAAAATEFVMGRAEDGGFWLFGGSAEIARTIWQSVPYSAPDTATRLLEKIESLGGTRFLPSLHDVDEVSDLAAIGAALARLGHPTASQIRLRHWIEHLRI